MNTLISIRQAYETGKLSKQDYIEAIHARHGSLFDYPEFLADTDVESLRLSPEGIYIRSRSQQIELILDPRDQHLVPYTLMNFRAYESEETQFLKSITQAGWTILDIGANCGWYSLILAKQYPTASIHAFEPIPHTYDILSRNIAHNGCINIHAHMLGLSNKEGRLEFLYTPSCSGATSLIHAGQPAPQEALQRITCPTSTLDLFCGKNNLIPQLIKCDVEGAELMVLQGGKETIATHTPILLIELLRKWAKKFGYHPNDVLDLLSRYGYQAYTLSQGRAVSCRAIHEATPETNFVFLHSDRHRHIIKP